MTEPAAVPEVASSEHDTILMARALVSPDPPGAVAVMTIARPPQPQISQACADLIEDALRKLWPALFRRGGARPERSTGAVRGRIWERHPVAPLQHSVTTLRVLQWLVAERAPGRRQETVLPAEPLTLGDQVLIYLALDMLGAAGQARFIEQPVVAATPLAWLGFAHVMPGVPRCSFEGLAEGAGAVVVEALAPELARRWYDAEIAKRMVTIPSVMTRIGGAQDATLTAWMDACDRQRRRDLAAFVIDAAAPLLTRGLAPLSAELDPTVRMAERMEARVAAGALLRGVKRWASWDEQHRAVRFIDEDYVAVQGLLARFERIGSAGVDVARGWLASLAALAPTSAGGSASIEVP